MTLHALRDWLPPSSGPIRTSDLSLTSTVPQRRRIPPSVPKTKVALTLGTDLVDRVDELVAQQRFRNRSQAIEAALAERLQRIARTRLAGDSAKRDPKEEKA